jgi:RNA polymerase sigma factor (TIGR02999 family)
MKPELRETLTDLIREIDGGKADAWAELLPAIYDQLRSLAGRISGPEDGPSTLSPTALVHEAWAKIANQADSSFVNREHFFAVAAMTMRQLLVDQARRKRAAKRGGGRERVSLSGLPERESDLDVVDLNEALTKLEQLSPRQARVVELRFFGGLTVPEVARCLAVSVPTIEADWRTARAWLGAALKPRES